MIYTIFNKRLKGGPLEVSYDVIQELSFTGIGTDTAGLYIACGLDLQHNSNELLFYSTNCSVENDIVTFTVNTYTENFLTKVTAFSTKAWLEIGRLLENRKEVLLFDDVIVQPRVYLEGEPPEPVPSSQYATMLWVQTNYQDKITPSALLSYDLLSGTPTIGDGRVLIYQGTELKGDFTLNQTSGVTIDLDAGGSGGVTSGWVDENYQKIISNDNKLSYSLLSATPSIPTVNNASITIDINGVASSFTLNQASNKTLSFTVEGGGGSGVTSAYVNQKISEHNVAVDAHSIILANYQKIITNSNKLSYSLISGTPSIPTKTSDLTNDSGFATSSWVSTNYQPIITSSRKLAYSLLSGTPTIPTVNNSTITFTQGGVTKGSFTLNQSTAKTIALDAGGGSTPGSGIITIAQGGAVKGSFNVNQSNNQTINLDAGGGGGGGMTYYQIYSSDTVLTAFHDCSYFWALQNQNATLYCENLQTANYDIPIDINLSGSTVTLSGITRNGLFADGCLNRCLITKRYDKTILYIYAYEAGYEMTQGLVGNWTTLGIDSSTYAGAAQVYTETTAGHYDSADGTYYIEQAGTNWRLFSSGGNEIAMGPASSDSMQGDYGTVAMAPLAGDSVLTVSLENIIVRS